MHGEDPAPAHILLLLIDGLGDVTVPSLCQRTPLQAAVTPCLDALAAAGCSGLLDPVSPGVACGSDTAHLSLLGYDPVGGARGRGAFEALGAGLELRKGDVAFKCNFARLDEASGVVTHRRADRQFEEDGPLLCAALDGLRVPALDGGADCVVHARYATEHRAGLLLRGPGLCDRVTGTDPLKDARTLLRSAALDGSPDAVHTAHMVNQACALLRATLRCHPVNAARAGAGKGVANCLLLRGPGSVLDELPFCARHPPYTGACVAPTKIIAGLALSLGMRLVVVPGATGDYRSDLAAKAQAAADALAAPGASAPSFLLCHLKAVDDAGHDRNVQKRVLYTQAADALLGQLVARLWRHGLTHTVICVTGDHSTPVLFGDHSTEPVPVAVAHLRDVAAALGGAQAMEAWPMGKIYTPEFQPAPGQPEQAGAGAGARSERVSPSAAIAGDAVCRFDELSCARGGLGRFRGGGLMDLLKAFARTQPETAAP